MTALELEKKGDEKMAECDYAGAETAYLDALAIAKKRTSEDRKAYSQIMNKYCSAVDAMLVEKEAKKCSATAI